MCTHVLNRQRNGTTTVPMRRLAKRIQDCFADYQWVLSHIVVVRGHVAVNVVIGSCTVAARIN